MLIKILLGIQSSQYLLPFDLHTCNNISVIINFEEKDIFKNCLIIITSESGALFYKIYVTIYIIVITYLYRVSVKKDRSHDGSMEEVKENKKVIPLYHFANFAIVNELLIIKNCPTYWLMQARDEMRPPC